MAVNLNIQQSISLEQPVDSYELQAVEHNYKQERAVQKVDKKYRITSNDIKLAVKIDNKQAKVRKKRSRVKNKNDENREKILQNAKIRKYTKEMQNRAAIIKKSRKMRNKAAKTSSKLDDKFAQAAMTPTRRFDKIIYNAITPDDASEILDEIFDDIVDEAASCSD